MLYPSFKCEFEWIENPNFPKRFGCIVKNQISMLNDYLITKTSYLEHCENLYLIILVISFSRANRILFTTTHLSIATQQCFTKKIPNFFPDFHPEG